MNPLVPAESPAELRRRLVVRLHAAHVLDPAWSTPFLDVSREPFMPHVTVPRPWGGQDFTPADTGYLRALHEDAPLTVRHDNTETLTTTTPAPTVTAAMLSALGDLPRGSRVLHVGVANGYLTALLSAKTGAEHVTGIELDPRRTTQAREALARTGLHPDLVTGDGTHGHAHDAPYDALLSTACLPRVPPAWTRQVRAGGTIVTRLGHALAALTVRPDHSADGPLLPTPAPLGPAPNDPTATVFLVRPGTRTTAVLPDLADDTARLLRGLLQPDVEAVTFYGVGEYRRTVHCLSHPATGSWARIEPQGASVHAIEYGGPRDLVGEIAPVLTHWANHDHPTPAHYGLTTTPDGTHNLWFETPTGPSWPLP
ncbi:protein-L-isoaspartate O-methyltransferase [Streptomyces sp. NPDC049879]|uniref:protein-L-isoaspartate O-methyltransferase n=1 Tax=Streptomyces sp. NPDC049879 TaxID=3365598 RepID=UPI0037AD676E